MSFTIFTDTSANLPTKWLKENNISAIPFSYFIDDEECACTDTDEFDYEAYYGEMRKGKMVTTSQINPQKYVDNFEPVLKEGKDIMYIGMSSGVSGSFRSASIAKTQLEEEYPDRKIVLIDTLGASLGEGIIVIRANEYKSQGMSIDEIADKLTEYIKCIYQVFTVDDLMYLKRSGRISNVTAVVGTVLNIKPLLKGNEFGKIVSFAKERGRKKAIEAMAKRYDTMGVNHSDQLVCIAHADCEEDAKYLESLVKANNPPKEILTVKFEPVTGSHVGPGMLAIFFEGDRDIRTK